MKDIDYRKRLGLGFEDKDKQKAFINRMQIFFQRPNSIAFNSEDERNLCYQLGVPCLFDTKSPYDFDLNEPTGLSRVWLYFEKRTNDFLDFLASVVLFVNTYQGYKKDKKALLSAIKRSLKDSYIEYEIIEDRDGCFFFPKGANELDNALISQPIEWLSDYPKTRKTFITALKQYSDGEYVRDTADNFRKALEVFFQEFLKNRKNLKNNITEVFTYLGNNNAEPALSGMVKTLVNSYDNLNNSAVKHNDKIDKTYLEFLMYQTGIFIRTLIVVRKSEDSDNET